MNMQGPVEEKRKTELLDALARAEHEQWKKWALELLDSEQLSDSRSKRWMHLITREWDSFTPEEKCVDYQYAEQTLWIVKKHLGIR